MIGLSIPPSHFVKNGTSLIHSVEPSRDRIMSDDVCGVPRESLQQCFLNGDECWKMPSFTLGR